MLVEFKVRNFRSFAEEQTISLRAVERDRSLPWNVISAERVGRSKLPLLKSVLLFGANASGKTNAIRALFSFQRLIIDSKLSADESPFEEMEPFRLDDGLREEPVEFAIKVCLEGVLYEYTVAATRERVHSESLTRQHPRGPVVQIFRRKGSRIDEWILHHEYKARLRLLAELDPTERAPLLSLATAERFDDLFNVRTWIEQKLRALNLVTTPWSLLNETTKRCKDKRFRETLGRVARSADVGIGRVGIGEYTQVVRSAKATNDPQTDAEKLEVLEAYHHDRGGGEVKFPIFSESTGTLRMLTMMGPVVDALRAGMTIAFDEMDASLHPHLMREIVSAINDSELNRNGAQIIIASHNTDLLDSDLVRRDQIVMVEKNDQGATELFTWYDFPSEDRARHKDPFSKLYLAGRFGGVPNLGALREALRDSVYGTSEIEQGELEFADTAAS